MNNNKCLIKDSTKEERKKRVDGAIVISMLDSKEPSNETKELFNNYINGEMEIDEIQKEIIKKLKKKTF